MTCVNGGAQGGGRGWPTRDQISSWFDLVGNTTDVDYPGGAALSFERDSLYRVRKIIDDDNPTVAVAAYSYNKAGEPTQLVLKNGARTAYTYDEVGRLESLVNYDPDDWVISSCGYTRNDVGCPTRITYQDGRRRDYAYDDLYRLTSEEHSDAQANSLLWHNYIYDEAGNRLKKLYDSDNEQTADRYTYAYDALNQVSTLTATGTPGDRIDVTGTVTDDNLSSVTVYNDTLDPVGAFEAQLRQMLFIARSVDVEEGANDLYALALDKSSNESRYPATGYHTVTLAAPPDPNLDYVFDANGCLVEVIEDTTTLKEYAYDHEKRLVEVKHGGIVVARFQYDALGRRVVVKLYDEVGALESTTRFIYNGDRVIEEYLDDSGWVFDAAYLHGLGIDNVLALTHDSSGTPSTYYYYHYDGIGSVTELTDADGALAQAYEYDAWGIATIYDPSSSIANPYLFTGRRWDAAIALYYYRARHYDPALGRFLQTDPAGYDAGINLYLYVGGLPTVFVDPSGLADKLRVIMADEDDPNVLAGVGDEDLDTDLTYEEQATDPNRKTTVQAFYTKSDGVTRYHVYNDGRHKASIAFQGRHGAARVGEVYNQVRTKAAVWNSGSALDGIRTAFEIGAEITGAEDVSEIVFGETMTGIELDTKSRLLAAGFVVLGNAGDGIKVVKKGKGLIEGSLETAGKRRVRHALEEALGDGLDDISAARRIASGNDVWKLDPLERGAEIHRTLTVGHPHELPWYARTIDLFDSSTGAATSIKTIDLSANTYQSPRKLRSKLRRCVKDVAKYEGETRGSIRITEEQIKSRSLDVVIPRGATGEQLEVLRDVVEYGQKRGVAVDYLYLE